MPRTSAVKKVIDCISKGPDIFTELLDDRDRLVLEAHGQAKTIATMQSEIETLKDDRAAGLARLGSLQSQVTDLERQRATLETELRKLQLDHRECAATIKSLTGQVESFQRIHSIVKRELSGADGISVRYGLTRVES